MGVRCDGPRGPLGPFYDGDEEEGPGRGRSRPTRLQDCDTPTLGSKGLKLPYNRTRGGKGVLDPYFP